MSGQRAATVVYRALLDSILKRGQTRAYSHGSRYLRKLDRLAEAVDDWGEFKSHAVCVAALRKKHRRKHSFWSKYD